MVLAMISRAGQAAILSLALAACTMTPPTTQDAPTENARGFLQVVANQPCGPAGFGGRYLQLRNAHPDRRISVTYRVDWTYQNQRRSRERTGTWSPGRTNPLGCTVPGPTGQRFNYTIVSARFL